MLDVVGKTRNIAIQLILQQCCNTSRKFFVARFSVSLSTSEFDMLVLVKKSHSLVLAIFVIHLPSAKRAPS